MFHDPLKKLAERWKIIFIVGLISAVLSLGATLLFPLEYRADAQVLIISKSRYGVDPYTVVKSAERVGENIAQIVGTSDFYTKVRDEEGYNIDWSRFDALTELKKRKLWKKTMQPGVVYGTGVLTLSAYHTDPQQAMNLVAAASEALVKRGWEYVGGDVTIKVVNNPVVTRFPVRPNLITNGILGFVAGILLGAVIIMRFWWKKETHIRI